MPRPGDRQAARAPGEPGRGGGRAARRPTRPRRADPPSEVPRPDLPRDHAVSLPRAVVREVERAARGRHGADAVTALDIGSRLLDEEDGAGALPYLDWARTVAPRVGVIREAVGVARYLTGDFATALGELRTYRRLTGRQDQNHLIADCLRALGRSTEDIEAAVRAMVGGESGPRSAQPREVVPEDRITEAVIVLASAVADEGDLARARRLVAERAAQIDGSPPEEQHLRLWYVGADLAERAGDRADARSYLERIRQQTTGFFDVDDRLGRLREA